MACGIEKRGEVGLVFLLGQKYDMYGKPDCAQMRRMSQFYV